MFWDGNRWIDERRSRPAATTTAPNPWSTWVSTGLMLIGLLAIALPLTRTDALTAALSLSPASGPAGTRVTARIEGVPAGTAVVLQWDDKALHTMGPGDVMIMQPKTPHYAQAKGETIVQIHGMGPWSVNYVNPADDPKNKAAAAPKKDEKKK